MASKKQRRLHMVARKQWLFKMASNQGFSKWRQKTKASQKWRQEKKGYSKRHQQSKGFSKWHQHTKAFQNGIKNF